MTQKRRPAKDSKGVERPDRSFGTEWQRDDVQLLARELASRARKANLIAKDLEVRTGVRKRKIQSVLQGYPPEHKVGKFLREEFVALVLDPAFEIDPALANALLILAGRADVLREINESVIRGDLITFVEWQRRFDTYRSATGIGHPSGRTPDPALFTPERASARLQELRRSHLAELKQNLPAYRTTFVGRDIEKQAVRERLGLRGLVTLWGGPGCGKSRLAVEVARETAADFPDGTWWVDLTGIKDDGSLIPAIATACRVELSQGSAGDLDALVHELHPRRSLIILDNCEGRIQPLRPVVQAINEGCPSIRLLATSREALAVEGEHVVVIDPLTPPDLSANPELLIDNDSVRLFKDRMPAPVARNLSGQDLRAIAEICRQLEGIPLAIEIVAPHTSGTPPQQLVRVLRSRLLGLKHSRGQIDARHETLRAAIAWSVEKLDQEAIRVFAALALFEDGGTTEALASVAGFAQDKVDLATQRLLECALATPLDHEAGALRVRLLEPLREYAIQELFAENELRAARVRHANWFESWLRSLDRPFLAPEPAGLHAQLEHEYGNARLALATFVERGDAQNAYAVARRCWLVWLLSGRSTVAWTWLSRVLALEGEVTVEDQVHVLRGAGVVARSRGDFHRSKAFLDEALRFSRLANDWTLVVRCLQQLASVSADLGDLQGALRQSTELRSIFEARGDEHGMAIADVSIGAVLGFLGEYARATAVLTAALPKLEADARHRAVALVELGEFTLAEGRVDEAELQLERALQANELVGDVQGCAYCAVFLAASAEAHGNPGRAGELARRALSEFATLRYPQGIVRALEELASQAALSGSPLRAVVLAAAADARRLVHPEREAPALFARYQARVSAARELITESEAKHWEEFGRTLSDEEVIALGLAETTDDLSGVVLKRTTSPN